MKNLAPAIRASLNLKLERLLLRPLIATLVDAEPEEVEADDGPDIFRMLQQSARAHAPRKRVLWREDPKDGTCSVRIRIDYDDLWRGYEKEVMETIAGTVESHVAFLTDEQRRLLERSPREFLELEPRPESAELLQFEAEPVGGSQRVIGLTVEAAPESRASLRHVAIIPNLIQLQRQLSGLQVIEHAADDGPLAPLRVLLGLAEGLPPPPAAEPVEIHPLSGERLDEFQTACLHRALTTPHFAVIQGPPGSGKTTVIAGIIRRALDRGERVLVVSPTHVAVDNVIEKLAPRLEDLGRDRTEAFSLPVRYAARQKKLSASALEYWVGRKKQRRGATIARRIQQRLIEAVPCARALFAIEDTEASGQAPLSAAVSRVQEVICGTPIGILSHNEVGLAAPGTFGLLIVDEVSKMTLPEFLAIAVKAKRWVLVGDPEQLPPFNNSEENAVTLDDLIEPALDLVCSVGALLEALTPQLRRDERLVVVSTDPPRTAEALRAHLQAVMPDNHPPISLVEEAPTSGIVVCAPHEVDQACVLVSSVRDRDRTRDPAHEGSLRILVERGVRTPRPAFASGRRFVEPRQRAQAMIFETSFNVYHAQPWSVRASQKLRLMKFRNGLKGYLPSEAALAVLEGAEQSTRAELLDGIAERIALNMISVYDWLTGIPVEHFDTSPVSELGSFSSKELTEAVQPYVALLKRQYRMHTSLSHTPRALFYFDGALHDGKPDEKAGCRVNLVQVVARGPEGESNREEAELIFNLLAKLAAPSSRPAQEAPFRIMIITPYRKQEALLQQMLEQRRLDGALQWLDIEVCTLDRCQGREAEYVFISLVRSRATHFLDMPKRWNVALTRAMEGLFLVGNIEAYLEEARAARRDHRVFDERKGIDRPLMSILARILEGYQQQIEDHARRALRGRVQSTGGNGNA